jgi:dephospho-CoA kinase
MITFGLTGGIACGKSTVTKTFLKNDIPMIDADIIARQVVEPGTFGLHLIGLELGEDLILSGGILDRAALGKLVFSDKKAMHKLNTIMMPLIANEATRQIAEAHKNSPIVGYDAALIIEQGDADKYRPLIVVSCPPEIQIARLMKRNGFSQEEAQARIDAQMPLAKKIEVANFVVDTTGTIEQSVAQTEEIIYKIVVMYTKQHHSRMSNLP